MDVMNKPLVSICCLAYNHEKFIRQCLDGFLIQKCNFNFEVLIHDDASTDKTASIIKEYEKKYPKIIKPIYQTENQYSKNIGVSKTYQYPRAQGKYIALCEGDDYWIDPLKLQKQVDFLRTNNSYKFVTHRYLQYSQSKEMFYSNIYPSGYNSLLKNSEDIGVKLNLTTYHLKWMTQPLTVLIEKDTLMRVISKASEFEYNRDQHLFYFLLKEGYGFCHNMISGVYRIHSGGVYSGQSEFNSYIKSYNIYSELYSKTKDYNFIYPMAKSSFALLYRFRSLMLINRSLKSLRYPNLVDLIKVIYHRVKFKLCTKKL